MIAPGLACDDGVALHYIDDELHRIVASRPDARAYRLTLEGESVTETVIDASYLGA